MILWERIIPDYSEMKTLILALKPGDRTCYYIGSLWEYHRLPQHRKFIYWIQDNCQSYYFTQEKVSEHVYRYYIQRPRRNTDY